MITQEKTEYYTSSQLLETIGLDEIAEQLRKIISDTFLVPEDFYVAKTRKQEYVFARYAYVSILRSIFGSLLTLEVYGGLIDRDHATVLHAIRTSDILRETDVDYLEKYSLARSKIQYINHKTHMAKTGEDIVQKQLVEYLKYQYPNIMFRTDLSGMRMSIGMAVKVKSQRSHNGFPDVEIMENRAGYVGCFLELKADGVRLKKKNGEWATDHIREQAEVHDMLRERGYYVDFAVGFDDAKHKADAYLNS